MFCIVQTWSMFLTVTILCFSPQHLSNKPTGQQIKVKDIVIGKGATVKTGSVVVFHIKAKTQKGKILEDSRKIEKWLCHFEGVAEMQYGQVPVCECGANSDRDHWVTRGNKPWSVTIGAHDVYQGLERGLIAMKVGGKRRITVPPSLVNTDKESKYYSNTVISDVEVLKVTNE